MPASVASPGRSHRDGGEPYKVFTPFWRAWERLGPLPAPLPVPGPWAGGRAGWRRARGAGACCRPGRTGPRACARPGSPASLQRGRRWPSSSTGPSALRHRPQLSRPSLPSRACRRGCIMASCRRGRSGTRPGARLGGTESFLRELVWREFAYHLLFHFPAHRRHAAAPRVRSLPLGRRARPVSRLDAWSDRLPAGRRRDARALAHGLHAQPGADGHGVLSDQGPADPLAEGGRLVLGHAVRRRPRQQLVRAGSGSPAAAPTRHPISASSIPPARRPSSTPRAHTSAAGCPNSDGCRLR